MLPVLVRVMYCRVITDRLLAGSSSSAARIPQLELHDGYFIPSLGLGTYQVEPGEETYNTVITALKQGYKMVDTAQMYDNEADVGAAIRDSGIARSKIWVQSKLLPTNHGYVRTIRAVKRSLQKMQLKYFDCFLIHSPDGGKLIETWDALLQLQASGIIRSIGVSNFGVVHLEALAAHQRAVPVINQIEMHPLVLAERQALVEYCQTRKIVVQAYGSLFYGKTEWLRHPIVASVAEQTGKTAAQVMLRWAFQKGFQVIPRSIRPERIASNKAIFDFALPDTTIQRIDGLKGSLGAYWDPVNDADVDLGEVNLDLFLEKNHGQEL